RRPRRVRPVPAAACRGPARSARPRRRRDGRPPTCRPGRAGSGTPRTRRPGRRRRWSGRGTGRAWSAPAWPTGPGRAGGPAAGTAGAALARTHRAGADRFGTGRPGYIGSLALPPGQSDGPWGRWFAEARLAPYLRMSADRGALSPAEVAEVEDLLDTIDRYA